MDPIADMLTQLRNAQAVGKADLLLPFSNLKFQIAKILKDNGFLLDVKSVGKDAKKKIKIDLLYKEKDPAISGIKKISKPGQRIYQRSGEIRPTRGGFGIKVISTPNGLMTDKEARKKKLGGEIICEVW